MRSWNKQIIREAQEFAARWGFLTQDLFFDFFCPMSQAQQYRYWSYLVDEGLFFKSKANPRVFLLTKKGRLQFGSKARPARQPIYVAHDAIAARVFLSLQQRGLIVRSWLEDELLRSPLKAFIVLGGERILRVPDLVFDLKIKDGGTIRCALEIEKTVKTHSRYAQIALAYLGYSGVNMVLFGCANAATESAIQKAFSGKTFIERKRVPGMFQYDEFDFMNLKASIRFQDKEFSIKNFLEIVTKSEMPNIRSLRE